MVLVSCTSGSSETPNNTTGASPTGGGSNDGTNATLKVGIVGSDTDNLDPHATTTAYLSELRATELYGSLTTRNAAGDVVWDLATDMTPNADLTEWTVKLRPGIKTHNGGTFTADDVIFSLKRILNPDQHAGGAPLIADIVDPNQVTKVDDTTVKFKLKKPYGPFKDLWADGYLWMIPRDWTKDKSDGTGPFKLEKFTPGQQTEMIRFDGYYGDAAKFKTLDLIGFKDIDAIVNALKGGQVDIAAQVPLTQAESLNKTTGLKVLQSKAPFSIYIGIRTDIPPFNDPRVMQAVKLMVNRQQVVDNAFNGLGSIANDIWSRGDASCPVADVPQRKQDLAKAKQLLAEAGKSNLSFEITNPNDTPGMSEMIQVIAANAKEIGVTVKSNVVTFAKYGEGWMKWPAGVDVGAHPYLFNVGNSLVTKGNANITHFNDPEFMKLADQLYATADAGKRCDIEHQMQKIEWEKSGYLITAWSDTLTGYNADKVSGLQPAVYNLSVFYLQNVSVKG